MKPVIVQIMKRDGNLWPLTSLCQLDLLGFGNLTASGQIFTDDDLSIIIALYHTMADVYLAASLFDAEWI